MPLADFVMPDARRSGKVIAEFSQSASVPTTTGNWYPAGYCAGLTMRWMLRRVQGQAWPADQKGKDAVAISWKAVGDYGTYLRNFDETWAILDDKAKVGLNAALGNMGMRVDDGIDPIPWTSGGGGKFFSTVAGRSDGLWYLSIQSNKGGHALGLHVQGRLTPPLHLFDPNLGHFGLANADDLERFGDALMSAYDRGMSAKFTWGKAYRIMPPQIGKAGP
jgi:hypothetical protein